MVQLTPQQHEAIVGSSDPVTVLDPTDGREYVLVPKETFDQILDEDSSASWYPLMEAVARREGWGDDEPDLYSEKDVRPRP
jgi:hypothetical protein